MSDKLEEEAREVLAAAYERNGNNAAAFTLRQVGAVGATLAGEIDAMLTFARIRVNAALEDAAERATRTLRSATRLDAGLVKDVESDILSLRVLAEQEASHAG